MQRQSLKSARVSPAAKPSNARKPKKSREELREAIVVTASRMFAERGYVHPTLREITKAAGVSLPIVYWFFADKRDLYKYCCTRVLEHDLKAVDNAIEGLSDPLAIIYCAVVASCENIIRDGGTPIIHRLMIENDTEILSEFAELLKRKNPFRRLDRALAKIEGPSSVRWLVLISMCVGVGEHSYLFGALPGMPKIHSTSAKLAEYVLGLVFPANDWPAVGRQVAPRVAKIRQQI